MVIIKINVFLKSVPRDSKIVLCSTEKKLVSSWRLRESAVFVCEENKIRKAFKLPNRNTNRSELLSIYIGLNFHFFLK